MASRRARPQEEEVEGFVMTPMIDIVFQLIIFFMLVLDMSKQQTEAVTLPRASEAIKMKQEDPQLLIINVMVDNPNTAINEEGMIRINGKTYWKQSDGKNLEKIKAVFENRRQVLEMQEVRGDPNWVKYPVLIRSDRSAHFEHLQKILMLATRYGGVTRIQLGAIKEK